MQMLSAPGAEPGEAPGASGPAPASHLAPSLCSFSLFFLRVGALRKPRGSFREAREGCGSPRGGSARGRCGGNVPRR